MRLGGGILNFVRDNVIAAFAFLTVLALMIGGLAYVAGVEKTARFSLATAYLTGGGYAILTEMPRETTDGYRTVKIVASSQQYDPVTKKFVTVTPPAQASTSALSKAQTKVQAQKRADALKAQNSCQATKTC